MNRSPLFPCSLVTITSWLEYPISCLGYVSPNNDTNNTNDTNQRGTVPSLHVKGLRMSPKSSVSRGHLAVFSAETSDDDRGSGGGKSLGLASGGEGLAWQDGALQNVRLGGTTKLEGDLDMRGHRLLNIDLQTPDLENIEVRVAHTCIDGLVRGTAAACCHRCLHRAKSKTAQIVSRHLFCGSSISEQRTHSRNLRFSKLPNVFASRNRTVYTVR